MKRHEIAVVPDESQIVAPRLVEAHADWGQGIGSAKLPCPHSVTRFGFEDAMAIEFAAIQKREREFFHVARRRRYPACWSGVENFKTDCGFFRGRSVTVGNIRSEFRSHGLVKAGMLHTQRLKNVLRDVLFERFEADALHDVAR